jgi:hypothetical protein
LINRKDHKEKKTLILISLRLILRVVWNLIKSIETLAEIDKTLLPHGSALRDPYHPLLFLLQTPPEKPRRSIGFNS